MDKLTNREQSTLVECEAVIERNLIVFYETGLALLKIRDGRLYRATHMTFEEYCRERWGIAASRARQLIGAAEVVENLQSVTIVTPATESQARELVRLEPEQQREVWQAAVQSAPNGKVTAAHIRETRESFNVPSVLPHHSSPTVIPFPRPPIEQQPSIIEVRQPHVSHNSGNNEWYTPAPYVDAAFEVMGGIDLDPASSDTANEIIEATTYYTAEDDGLTKDWTGRVWMNPPYASELIGKFTSKLCQHFNASEITEAIVLVNNATETGWFQEMLALASAVCFPKGRIKYLDTTGNPANTPLQGQTFLYFGKNPNRFKKVFNQFGGVR